MSRVDDLMDRAFREWRGVTPSPDLRSRFEKRLAAARALEQALASWEPVRAERVSEFDSKLEAQQHLDAALRAVAVTPSTASADRFAARLPRPRLWKFAPLSYVALVLAAVGIPLFVPRAEPPGPKPETPALSFAREVYFEKLLADHENKVKAIDGALTRLTTRRLEAIAQELRHERALAAAELSRRVKRAATLKERVLYLRLLAELGAAKELYRCAMDDPWHSQEALDALVRIDDESEARPWFERAARNPRTRAEFFKAAGRYAGDTAFRYLGEMLKDPSLRTHALDALVQLRDPRAIRELALLLADPGALQMVVRPDGTVRSNDMTPKFKRQVIAALGELSARAASAVPDYFAIEVLIDVMSDRRFQQDAHDALRLMLDRDFGPDPAEWRRGMFLAGG